MEKPTFEITLTTLTYGGDAMGRLSDRRAVFVPFGLPGERVRVRILEDKQNFARGELIEVIEASPDRIAARCPHFFAFSPAADGSRLKACGGCHYQHLPYSKQREAKASILRDQLTRIGKIQDPPVAPTVPSSSEWNYRNHVQFHLTEEGRIGFVNVAGNKVVPIAECHLPEDSINTLWPQLQFETDTDIQRVSLRSGADGDLLLALESDSPEPPALELEAGISVAHLYDDHAVVLAGDDHLVMRVSERDFKVSAPSFFQVNTAMAEKMVAHLLASLPVTKSDTVLDLYCGVGLFSAFFASHAGKLIGVESSPSACEDFVANLDTFDNVALYEGAAEEVLPGLAAQVSDLRYAIVDPPRAGLDRHVIDALTALRPERIAYVSCDPSTLARDAKRLIEAGYSLEQVTPFDLFPQTYHIESISIFIRA
jgi:23S rRNA (uracil1939-C5)-methyltransferase